MNTENLYLKEHGRTHSGADFTDADNPQQTASQTEQSFLQKKQEERNKENERKPSSKQAENFPYAVNAKPSQTEKSFLRDNQVRHIEKERNFTDADTAQASTNEKSILEQNRVNDTEKGRIGNQSSVDDVNAKPSQTEKSFLRDNQVRDIEKEGNGTETFMHADTAKTPTTEKSVLEQNKDDTEMGRIGTESVVDADDAKPPPTEKSDLEDIPVRETEKASNGSERPENAVNADPSQNEISFLQNHQQREAEKVQDVQTETSFLRDRHLLEENKDMTDSKHSQTNIKQDTVPMAKIRYPTQFNHEQQSSIQTEDQPAAVSETGYHSTKSQPTLHMKSNSCMCIGPAASTEQNATFAGYSEASTTNQRIASEYNSIPEKLNDETKVPSPLAAESTEQHATSTGYSKASTTNQRVHSEYNSIPQTLDGTHSCQTETCIGYNIYSVNDTTTALKDPETHPRNQLLEQNHLAKSSEPKSCLGYKAPLKDSQSNLTKDPSQQISTAYSEAIAPSQRLRSEYNSIPETLDARRSNQTDQTRRAKASEPNICIGYDTITDYISKAQVQSPPTKSCYCTPKQSQKLSIGQASEASESRSMLVQKTCYCRPEDLKMVSHQVTRKSLEQKSEQRSLRKSKISCVCSKPSKTKSERSKSTQGKKSDICNLKKNDQFQDCESSSSNTSIQFTSKASKAISWMDNTSKLPKSASCYCASGNLSNIKKESSKHQKQKPEIDEEDLCTCNSKTLKNDTSMPSGSLQKSMISGVSIKPSKTKSERSKSTQENKSGICNLEKNDQFQECDSSFSNTFIPCTSNASKPISWMEDISKPPNSVSCASGNLSDIKKESSMHHKQKPEIDEEDLCTCNSETLKNDTSMPSGETKDEENLYDPKSATINEENNENSHCYLAMDSCYRSARSITGDDVGQDALRQMLNEDDGCECYDAMIEQRLQELTMLLRLKEKESEKKSQTRQISFEECIEAARNQPNEDSKGQSEKQRKRQERLEKKHQDLQKCLGITRKTQEHIEIYNVEFDKGFETGGENSFYDDVDEDNDDDVASQFVSQIIETKLDDDEYFGDCYSPTQTADEPQICAVSKETSYDFIRIENLLPTLQVFPEPEKEVLPKEKVIVVIPEKEPPPKEKVEKVIPKQEPQPEDKVIKVIPTQEPQPEEKVIKVIPKQEPQPEEKVIKEVIPEKVKEVSSVQAVVKPCPCPTPCICCHCRALECDNACKTVTKTLDAVLCDPTGEMKYFIDSIVCDLNAMDHVLCKKEVKPKPSKNQGTVGFCPRDSFPVTISEVSSLGCAALYLRWEIEDCSGIAGYEIYVDGHLTNRFYSYRHKAGVATNVDVTKSHQIVLRAHPIGQDFAGDSCTYSSEFNPYPELNAGATRPWSPSVFFYNPIQPSYPHTSQVPSQNQMAISGSPPDL